MRSVCATFATLLILCSKVAAEAPLAIYETSQGGCTAVNEQQSVNKLHCIGIIVTQSGAVIPDGESGIACGWNSQTNKCMQCAGLSQSACTSGTASLACEWRWVGAKGGSNKCTNKAADKALFDGQNGMNQCWAHLHVQNLKTSNTVAQERCDGSTASAHCQSVTFEGRFLCYDKDPASYLTSPLNDVTLGWSSGNECACTGGTAVSGNQCTSVGQQKCSSCDAGYKKVGDVCNVCPAGTKSNAGSSSCTACNAGYKSTSPPSAQCTQCEVGEYSSSPPNALCNSCPAKHSSIKGSSSISQCHLCSCAGGTPSDNDSNECKTPGVNHCKSCKIGYFSNGANACNACAKGKYSSAPDDAHSQGDFSCKTCANGKYAHQTAMKACQQCSNGESSPLGSTSIAQCVSCVCANGQRSDNTLHQCTIANTTHCKSCNSGFNLNSAKHCVANGCTCTGGTAATGTACTLNGAHICDSAGCQAGRFYNTSTKKCDSCAAGKFSTAGGTCQDCPGKTWSSGGGDASTCVACGCKNGTAGQQCTLANREKCLACDAGFAHSATKCTTCNSSQFSTGGTSQCQTKQCSCSNGVGKSGVQCSTHGAQQCKSCNAGFGFDGSNCVKCTGNKQSTGGTLNACARCSDGQRPNADNSACIANVCQCTTAGASSAAHAATGASCATHGMDKCKSCPPGYKLVNHQCTKCDANTFSNKTANVASTCTACPANHVSPQGSTSSSQCKTTCSCNNGQAADGNVCVANQNKCKNCRAGHKLVSGQCVPCAAGFYSANAASTSATCIKCDQWKHSAAGASTCIQNNCTCARGTPATGTGCTSHNGHICKSCDSASEHVNASSKCAQNICKTCIGGTTAVGADCTAHDTSMCSSCGMGRYLDSFKQCAFCPAGSFSVKTANTANQCTQCPTGHHSAPGSIQANDCVKCQCPFGTPGTLCTKQASVKCSACPDSKYAHSGGKCKTTLRSVILLKNVVYDLCVNNSLKAIVMNAIRSINHLKPHVDHMPNGANLTIIDCKMNVASGRRLLSSNTHNATVTYTATGAMNATLAAQSIALNAAPAVQAAVAGSVVSTSSPPSVINCAAGQKFDTATNACADCPAGQYSLGGPQMSCTPCAAGSHAAQPKSASCSACSLPSKYQDASGQALCKDRKVCDPTSTDPNVRGVELALTLGDSTKNAVCGSNCTDILSNFNSQCKASDKCKASSDNADYCTGVRQLYRSKSCPCPAVTRL